MNAGSASSAPSGIIPALLAYLEEEGGWQRKVNAFVEQHGESFRGGDGDAKAEEQKVSTFELFRQFAAMMERGLEEWATGQGLRPAALAEELRAAQNSSETNEWAIQAILGALEYESFVRLMSRELERADAAKEAAADLGF